MNEIDEKLESAHKALTPKKEEQLLRLLQGKCPHNKGWTWIGHSHNDDAYRCNLCRTIDYF